MTATTASTPAPGMRSGVGVAMHSRGPTARRSLWRATAASTIWLTSLLVAAIWVSGGGLQAVSGVNAEALNTLGRLTGLISANLLLYQVLLMARVPLFEKGFGRDGITRMHRRVGFWSFWLMLAHIVLLVLGYAAQSSTNVFVQVWDFVWNYPAMLLATVGTILLVGVVVTSIRRARKRLRYESWHLLHLYAYVGVGIAIPHQLWTGADFLASPLATAYWWTLWALAAISVVAYRIVLPWMRSVRHDVRVLSVAADGQRGVLVRMRGRHIARLRAQPGQFFVWRFLDGPGFMRGHPFSLAAAPVGDDLTISARIVGDGTHRLTQLRKGTRALVEGPFGHMTGEVRTGAKLLMIGAGAGVAPLVALLESEPYAADEATLITRDHAAQDALRTDAIARLVRQRGLRLHTLNGPRTSEGSVWLPSTHAGWRGGELIRYIAPDLAAYDVYLCGPGPWMESVRRDLLCAGVVPERIHSESFTI